ncbi:unnamed protein product [Ambrosiozyma monospora]|uniref:Unnamed protein product n=1 Tax=Ambrosiozyma monospora TaxID=43982 RepID=A0ACB5TBN0_AMBMO|nr:unnamed protein product [Ambrosiozyma monospora]
MGIVCCASGAAGVVFSLSSQKLIDDTGSYQWSLRMLAIIGLVLNIIVLILTKPRIPRKRLMTWVAIKERINILFDFQVLKIWQIHSVTIWVSLVLSCYVVSLFSLAAYCVMIGMTQREGSHVTAIFNGFQAIGRVCIGLSADKVGRVNLSVVLTAVVYILIFAMWINIHSTSVVYAYAVLAGLFFGVASTLHQTLLADSVPLELFPAAWSYEQFVIGIFNLFCEVIALKLRSPGSSQPFLRAELFSGFFAFGGFVFIVPLRENKVKVLIEKRLEKTEDALAKLLVGSEYEESTDQDHEQEQEQDDNGNKSPSIGIQEKELLYQRRTAYRALLKPGLKGYFTRLFYPIKV